MLAKVPPKVDKVFVNRVYLKTYGSSRIIYCQNLTPNNYPLSFGVWLTPYSNESWLLILVTLISICFVFALKNIEDKSLFLKAIFISTKIVFKQASVKSN